MTRFPPSLQTPASTRRSWVATAVLGGISLLAAAAILPGNAHAQDLSLIHI